MYEKERSTYEEKGTVAMEETTKWTARVSFVICAQRLTRSQLILSLDAKRKINARELKQTLKI